MRIISRFSDYYDGLRSLDQEATPLYVRDTRRVDLAAATVAERRRELAPLATWNRDDVLPPALGNHLSGIIGFCGTVHAFYVVGERICFDVDDVAAALTALLANGPRNSDDADLLAQLDTRPSSRRWWRPLTRRSWRDYLAARPTLTDEPFRLLRAPAFVWTGDFLEVNPRLSAYDFPRRVDPWTAWQELAVFLGNNLVEAAAPPRPISDQLKAEAHGFDKASFKKQPGRKKVDRSSWE